MNYPIVIPLHHTGGKLRDNTELRYALRSIATHFKDEHQLAIVGKRMPDWAQGIEHVPSNAGLKTALRDAAARFPDGFFWWYDDCCLLRDTTGEEMKITPCCASWKSAKTKWARGLNRIGDRLRNEGFKAWDYSRPHGPYWFDKAMVDESFADWPGMKSKFPFETWILSKHDWPRVHGAVKQYYGPFRGQPNSTARYLNYNDKGNTPDLRAWLSKRFPDASPWEKAITTAVSVPVITPHQTEGVTVENRRVLFTCHEGCDARVWQWCGPGIKAFAKSYQADLVELPKCQDTNPQWVLFDAFKASLAYSDADEFAWIDSDIVVAYPATNFWQLYPKNLHLCRKDGDFANEARERFSLPANVLNNCTGIVKWIRAEAEKLAAWYDANKHRFDRADGDQELLGVALHELGMKNSWFHPRMHVAGHSPPPRTAFKHKGGPSKIRWIPRFLARNEKLGIAAPKNQMIVSTAMQTYRICMPGKELPGEIIVPPVFNGGKMRGATMAHMSAADTAIKNDVFPCLVLEEDAAWMVSEAVLPESSCDWIFVGLSKYDLAPNGRGVIWSHKPKAENGLIDMDAMLGMHAIIYNSPEAARRVMGICMAALLMQVPVDVALVKYCLQEGIQRKGLAKPWFYQSGENAVVTHFEL